MTPTNDKRGIPVNLWCSCFVFANILSLAKSRSAIFISFRSDILCYTTWYTMKNLFQLKSGNIIRHYEVERELFQSWLISFVFNIVQSIWGIQSMIGLSNTDLIYISYPVNNTSIMWKAEIIRNVKCRVITAWLKMSLFDIMVIL